MKNTSLAPSGYQGIWFTLGQFSEFGDKYSGGLGTYTANHNPMAVYSPQSRKTFFTYGGTIPEKRHLLIMAGVFDHQTGLISRPTLVHDKDGVDDPHDNASIAVDARGYVWLFISGRARTRPGFLYRGHEPHSIERFELIDEREMTYPQPWPQKNGGFFHLFTKYTAGRELYFEVSAEGRKWSETQKLAGFGGHYQVSGQASDGTIGTFWNWHPGGNVDRRTNLYYAQTGDGGQSWTNGAGEALTLPLESPHNAALVENYAAHGILQYTCDLNFDAQNRPQLLYVASRDARPGPQSEPRQLRLTKWTGREWKTSVVAPQNHNYDMGSLWTATNEWKIIVPLVERSQRWQGGGEIGLWTSRDEGQNWKLERQITRGSAFNHNYVRRPHHAADPFWAFWADGDPTQFSASRLYFCDSSGKNVFQLPTEMKGDWAPPLAVR